MSEYKINIQWDLKTPTFEYKSYERTHKITFNGGKTLHTSSPKEFLGNSEYPNPEEIFTASIASCQMLTFLAIAANSSYEVVSYEDNAIGILEKDKSGKFSITKVLLRPKVKFRGDPTPSSDEIMELHKKAHKNCLISNSILTKVEIETMM